MPATVDEVSLLDVSVVPLVLVVPLVPATVEDVSVEEDVVELGVVLVVPATVEDVSCDEVSVELGVVLVLLVAPVVPVALVEADVPAIVEELSCDGVVDVSCDDVLLELVLGLVLLVVPARLLSRDVESVAPLVLLDVLGCVDELSRVEPLVEAVVLPLVEP